MRSVATAEAATTRAGITELEPDNVDPLPPSPSEAQPSWTEPSWAPAPVPPPPPPAVVGSRWKVSRWVVVFAVLGLLLATSVTVARFVRVPYDAVGPGGAHALSESVKIVGHPSFPPEGEVLSTTVSVRERVNVLVAIAGWLDPDTDVVPVQEVSGDITPAEYRELNVVAMSDSKTVAQLLALRHLGFESVTEGSEIIDVEDGLPASDVLRKGDVIVEVDGSPNPEPPVVVAAIQARKPGDVLKLKVKRGAAEALDVEAPLGSGEGRTLLGVRMTPKIRLPFEIEIESGDVVGPSAGLAYALELVDLLTPGELTGGAKVAVTGDLSPDGKVGEIGGIAQKAAAVRAAGVKVFLVPKGNLAEARARAGGLDIRPVGSFEEALSVLGGLRGSNALALGRPGATE